MIKITDPINNFVFEVHQYPKELSEGGEWMRDYPIGFTVLHFL
jgi:hypothetical protein